MHYCKEWCYSEFQMKFLKLTSINVRLLTYFIGLAVVGVILFRLPVFYVEEPVSFVDSLFTTVSAICVTGLASVDMSVYSTWGLVLLLFLIEAGGLGFVSFLVLYAALPSKKMSLVNRRIVKDFFIDEVEVNPRLIVRRIVGYTLVFELIGGFVLAFLLQHRWTATGEGVASLGMNLFYGMFLAVSAFCNAGFAPYSNNLQGFVHEPLFIAVILVLIVCGGLGFTVFTNLLDWLSYKTSRGKRSRVLLTLHTRIVLLATAFLIVSGAVVFFAAEAKSSLAGLSWGERIMNALFQSVTLRTAGFETVAQREFSVVSELISVVYMFIGGSPGSIAGGVKTTTVFVLLCVAFRSSQDKGNLSLWRRDISQETVEKASVIVMRSLLFVFIVVLLLLIAEADAIDSGVFDGGDLIFEAVSAFCTVGLTRGVTMELSGIGKVLIIITMFIGRTGVAAMILSYKKNLDSITAYPEANILVG